MSRAWPTMAEVADAVSRELAVGDIDMAHRLVMDGVNRLPAAAEAGLLSHVLEPPASAGDQRWDALLAAHMEDYQGYFGRMDLAFEKGENRSALDLAGRVRARDPARDHPGDRGPHERSDQCRDRQTR